MARKSKLTQTMLFFAMLLIFLCAPGQAAALELLNGKLDLRGNVQQTCNYRTNQDVRGVEFSSFRTVGRAEALYKIIDFPDRSLDLHFLGHYNYDAALDISDDQEDAIEFEGGETGKLNFRRPRSPTEWLTEFYVDMKYKEYFQLKLGKQLVSWGETAESRVADLINPLDYTYLLAFPDWEDYKLGLWMARFFITPTNLWQNMSFELLVIPEFLGNRMPPAGSGLFFGSAQSPGTTQKVLDKQKRDAPDQYDFSESEIGFRVKGYAQIGQGVDWYLSHFRTRADSPIINGPKAGNKVIFLSLGLPYSGKIFRYPWYHSTAATFATTAPIIGSSLRGEVVYNTGRKYQYGSFEVKERNILTASLAISKDVTVPWLSEWNRNTAYSCTLTGYQYYMPNYINDHAANKHIMGETMLNSALTKVSLSVATGFVFYTIVPYVNVVHDPTNSATTFVGGVSYAPGDHWSWSCSYQHLFNQGIGKYQDQLITSMRYEFW